MQVVRMYSAYPPDLGLTVTLTRYNLTLMLTISRPNQYITLTLTLRHRE